MNLSKNSQVNKLLKYEEEIVKFFIKSGKTKGASETLSKIFGYFITRGELTQKEIQKLAGTSAGTTSKTIQLLQSLGIIQVNRKPGSRENFYQVNDFKEQIEKSMENMFKEFFRSRNKFLKLIKRRFNKLNKEIEDLENNGYKKELEKYDIMKKAGRVRNFIDEYSKIIPVLKKGAELFIEE
ncbi:MAG: hypothetical protein GF329_11480 [Candidatus Lokiarchaeota archaeon]|nr:hypothetical protein [Candidatus Lokiarchaeota archaeon]